MTDAPFLFMVRPDGAPVGAWRLDCDECGTTCYGSGYIGECLACGQSAVFWKGKQGPKRIAFAWRAFALAAALEAAYRDEYLGMSAEAVPTRKDARRKLETRLKGYPLRSPLDERPTPVPTTMPEK